MVVVAGMRAAKTILVPFFLAIFIALISSPLMTWLKRHKINTGVAILVIITIVILAGMVIGTIIGNSVNDFAAKSDEYTKNLASVTTNLTAQLGKLGIDASGAALREQLNPGSLVKMTRDVLSGITGALANTFMILVTVIFILLEAYSFPLKMRSISDDPNSQQASMHQIQNSINRYIAIKTVISFFTGLSVYILLLILRIDYAPLWALIAFLFNFVPSIGSLIAAIPVVLVAMVQYGMFSAMFTAVGYFGINTLFGSFIEPRLLGQSLGLSPLVVWLSLIFWGWILGPVGMLLSVLLTMIFKIVLESNEDTHWISVLLGPDPDLVRKRKRYEKTCLIPPEDIGKGLPADSPPSSDTASLPSENKSDVNP